MENNLVAPKLGARRRRYQLLVAAIALVVAACGDASPRVDSSDLPQGDQAPVTAGPTTTSGKSIPGGSNNPIPVRYTQAGTSFTFANLLYAISAGYFEAEGLDVEYLPFPPSSGDVLTMVVAREADVSFSAPSAFYSAVSQGRRVKQYATTQKGPMIGLALHNDIVEKLAAQGVTVDSPIEDRVAALAGLSIASVGAGSSTYAAFEASLATGGLAITDITHLPVPGHEEAVNAAREGQSDGSVAAAPALLLPEVDEWGSIWYMYTEIPSIGDLPWAEFVAHDDFVSEYPEGVPAILRALLKARDDFEAQPDQVKEVLKSNWYPDMDHKLFDAAFELAVPFFTQDIVPTEDGLTRSLALYNATAEVPIELSFSDVYDVAPIQAVSAGK